MALNTRAMSKNKLGDYFGAIYDFTQVLELEPDNSEAFGGRCYSKYKISKYKSALEDCNRSIEIDPVGGDDGDIFYKRALIKMNINEKYGACSDYKIAKSNGSEEAKDFLNSRKAKWCTKFNY